MTSYTHADALHAETMACRAAARGDDAADAYWTARFDEIDAALFGSGTVETSTPDNSTPRPVIVLTLLMAIAALAIVLGTIAPSHAVQLEKADREVSTVRVSYVEQVSARRIFVELNNGAAYRLSPCRYEDGRHCFWDAGSAGNGIGRSFVVVAGRVLYTDKLR